METQQTITKWADKAFGQTTLNAAYERYMKEVDELEEEMLQPGDGPPANLPMECADILITLYRVAEVAGFDLHQAVDTKMQINRAREWTVNPDGTGQHK